MNGPAWLEDVQALAACRPSLRIGTEHAVNVARARETRCHALAACCPGTLSCAREAGGGDAG
jgi:hypothetical protein